ncbi:hypothetical protein NXW27_17445 [Phocaeicola dorei]|nr:hypothetical protein [Phocaeicola dorei]
MKSLLKFPLLVAVATMMSCSFSACSDNDDPTPDTVRLKQMQNSKQSQNSILITRYMLLTRTWLMKPNS